MTFSVIIPCHDPDPAMLEHAVRSVVDQLDRRTNQVVIVDDASTDASVCDGAARRHGVAVARSEQELGGVATHNAGYEMAQNELVHVLHPDDWVLGGFYDNAANAAAKHPDRALYAARAVFVDVAGRPTGAPAPDWLAGRSLFQPLHEGNPLCVAACVVRRQFVAEHGAWDGRLIHTADWEFWVRATTRGGAAIVHWPLAVWRMHPANHTHRLARTAENLRDVLRLGEVVRPYAPSLVDETLLRRFVGAIALSQARTYRAAGELCAAAANEQLARETEAEP